MSDKKAMNLSARIFLGMILGAIFGLVLNYLGNPQWSEVWLTDGISFYFFELFALANFALFFVQATFVRFPYALFEFPWPAVNAFFRAIRVMPHRSPNPSP